MPDPGRGVVALAVVEPTQVGEARRPVAALARAAGLDETASWPDRALPALHPEGLATPWRLADRPALRARAPGVIAGAHRRDFGRGRDDVTTVVARVGGVDAA